MGASVEETKQLVGREELPALCERLRPCLRRILRRHQIPAEDAEDLVQTALLLAVARWHEIRCPEVWLLGTLQNRCILYWRERRLNEARYVELGEWRPQFAIEPIQDHRDRLADLDRACRTLPAGQRKLLALRYHLGFSPGETARALGLAPGSVRKTANRACELLRRQVGRRGVEPAEERIESGPVRVVSWTAALVPYLYRFPRNTRRLQDGHLRAAVARLGCGTIAEVTVERLQDYRSAVLADGRLWTTQAQALSALRRFLVWAGRRRLHGHTPELIRETLGLPRGFTSKPLGAGPPATPMAGEERPPSRR
jgi:RNA polymerase sigma factor (sigma-70 family)